MEICNIFGSIRVQPMFTCAKCGAKRGGTGTITIHVDYHMPDSIAARIANRAVPRELTPIGWSSNGTAGVTCPDCEA
jgi:hypothetical protein